MKVDHIPFQDLFPPCTLGDVRELEKYFGFPLPDDYREFLLRHNGVFFDGFAIFRQIESNSTVEYGVVNRLCGLSNPVTSDDLRHWRYRDGYDFKDRVPDHIKVIGTSLVNGFITMSLGPDDFGRIYVWAPCLDWDEPQYYHKDYEILELAGMSFSSWWDSLQYRQRAGFSLYTGEYETDEN